jgi:transcriptional regulator with XRE-family HTH domain
LFFFDLDNPKPHEIKGWMKNNNLTIETASKSLGVSKRQFSRFLSGETSAKKVHTLAMQMIWLINENKKIDEESKNNHKKNNSKRISIPIK